jgi:hypothetical protein
MKREELSPVNSTDECEGSSFSLREKVRMRVSGVCSICTTSREIEGILLHRRSKTTLTLALSLRERECLGAMVSIATAVFVCPLAA